MDRLPIPAITFIFRKRSSALVSIEKLFGALYQHFERSGVSVRRLELPHISNGIISVLRNAWFVARQRRKGILHITGDVHYAALLCPFSRTIVTVHDCVVLQRGTGVKRWVFRLLWFRLPLRLASVVATVSDRTRGEILQNVALREAKVTVIPNFIEPPPVCGARAAARGRVRVLHVGTRSNKNLLRVVRALRDISCVLTIVGELSEEILITLRDNGVRYENFVDIDDEQVSSLYLAADIISFPSLFEGFGMPILEGQAAGRPVLTSDLEPMRSVAGPDGALLVDPESVDAIREGFVKLMNDAPLRARLVAAGKRNCSRFTLDAVADRYLTLYRSLA